MLFVTHLIAFVCGLLAFLYLHRRGSRLNAKRMKELQDRHRAEWEDLIHKLNHKGMIPHGSSAAGLTDLILRAVLNSIVRLETLFERKEWNTMSVISELRGIALVEITMLKSKLTEFLQAQRDFLREYNYKQEKEGEA